MTQLTKSSRAETKDPTSHNYDLEQPNKANFFKVNDKMNQAQSVTLESAWILSGYNDLWAVASCNQTEI